MTEIAQGLKRMAKSLSVPVIGVAHVKRSLEAEGVTIALVHDAGFILPLPFRQELTGIDDDALPAVVPLETELEHENARLDSDDHALQRCHFVRLCADDGLAVQKQHDQVAQARELVG